MAVINESLIRYVMKMAKHPHVSPAAETRDILILFGIAEILGAFNRLRVMLALHRVKVVKQSGDRVRGKEQGSLLLQY